MSGGAVPPAERRIEIARRESDWVVTLYGEHDVATHPGLEAEVERLAAAGGRIVVDLSHAAFLDSSVIRALATRRDGDGSARRVAGVVAPAGTFAGRLAALVNLDAVIPVHASVEEALHGGSRR